jgi:hypothetical protein
MAEQAIKITLDDYSEPLIFAAVQYRQSAGEPEQLVAYAKNTFPEGLARARSNNLGVERVAIIRPSRRPFVNNRRVASNSMFYLRPEKIASAEIIDLEEEQQVPDLPEEFVAQVVDSSEPEGQELGHDQLRAGNYYIATDRQGISGRLYIRNIHNSATRMLVEVVFDDGGQRVVTADSFHWRADYES